MYVILIERLSTLSWKTFSDLRNVALLKF